MSDEPNFVSGYEAMPLEADPAKPGQLVATLKLAETRRTEEGRGHALRVTLKTPYNGEVIVNEEFRFEVRVEHPRSVGGGGGNLGGGGGGSTAAIADEDGGMSGAAVAGIIVGVLVALALVVVVVYWAWRNRKWCFSAPQSPSLAAEEFSAVAAPLNEPNERPIIRPQPRPSAL